MLCIAIHQRKTYQFLKLYVQLTLVIADTLGTSLRRLVSVIARVRNCGVSEKLSAFDML